MPPWHDRARSVSNQAIQGSAYQHHRGRMVKDETNWPRHLLVGVIALAVGAALVGGVGGYLTLHATELAGIRAPSATSHHQSQQVRRPADPKAQPSQAPASAQIRPRIPRHGIAVTATPKAVAAYERVNLTGSYLKGANTSLRVQRLEDGNWVDFPASATAATGSFATYIQTGQVGVNQFRLRDPATGRTSNVVKVTIG
ncbi:MAG: hypothetical protein WKF82_12255 [Nocardioidaceae bacterium]